MFKVFKGREELATFTSKKDAEAYMNLKGKKNMRVADTSEVVSTTTTYSGSQENIDKALELFNNL